MASSTIYLDATNYTSAVNGKYYTTESYMVNYPVAEVWYGASAEISITQGDQFIELTSGTDIDFFDLFGPNRNNADIIRYPYIIGANGELIKVISVLSATTAKISTPCIFPTALTEVKLLDIYGQPTPVSTVIGNASDATATNITITTESSYDISANVAPSQSIEVGTDPVLVSVLSTPIFMIINF